MTTIADHSSVNMTKNVIIEMLREVSKCLPLKLKDLLFLNIRFEFYGSYSGHLKGFSASCKKCTELGVVRV